MRRLSIIIPVYNEEQTIALVLEKIFKQKLTGWQKEIIVVDDGSSDETLQRLKPYLKDLKLVKHRNNLGKGAAIRNGLESATGEAVVIQDADLEYDPQDWPRLLGVWHPLNSPVIYGSRNIRPLRRGYWQCVLGVWLLTGLVNFLYAAKLTDVYTCYKLFSTPLLKSLKLEGTGFEIEAEITCKILKRGIKIQEVPIAYLPRRYQEGKKIKFKDGLVGMWTILKEKAPFGFRF